MQDADEGRENGERRKTLNIQHSPPRPAFQGGTAGSTTMFNAQVGRGERQGAESLGRANVRANDILQRIAARGASHIKSKIAARGAREAEPFGHAPQ